MYPDSIFQWLGYIAVVFGILGLIGIIAFSLDDWIDRREERHKNDKGEINIALAFIALTAILVTIGCWLYVSDHVGLAQFMWVLASGTAGAGCVLWIDK